MLQIKVVCINKRYYHTTFICNILFRQKLLNSCFVRRLYEMFINLSIFYAQSRKRSPFFESLFYFYTVKM